MLLATTFRALQPPIDVCGVRLIATLAQREMLVFRTIGLWLLKAAAVVACLFSYFVTLGITLYVPGGEPPERLWHFLILLGISLFFTALTVLLFRKPRKFLIGVMSESNIFWRRSIVRSSGAWRKRS